MLSLFKRKGRSGSHRPIDLSARRGAGPESLPIGRIVAPEGRISARIADVLERRLPLKGLCRVKDILLVSDSRPGLEPLKAVLELDQAQEQDEAAGESADVAVLFTCELIENSGMSSLIVEKACYDLRQQVEFGCDGFRIDPQSGHQTEDELVQRAAYLMADLCLTAMTEVGA